MMSLAFLSLPFSSTRTFGSVLKSHALGGDKKTLIKLNINSTAYSNESISSFEKAFRTYHYLGIAHHLFTKRLRDLTNAIQCTRMF